MRNQALVAELETLLGGYLQEQGLDLIELICRYEGRGLALRLLVDKPEGGISLEECAQINSRIGSMLDEKDIMQEHYVLEVSSPGLDRPLRTRKDFIRCQERRVRFFFSEPVMNKVELCGVIKRVNEESVDIETEEGAQIQVNLAHIARAKQVIE